MLIAAEMLRDTIEVRREGIVHEAKNLIENWFPSSKSMRSEFRAYAPALRRKDTAKGTSISIYWNRRILINGSQGMMMRQGRNGPMRLTKVSSEYIPARKTGVAYPASSFPYATADELEDILAMEERLGVIRAELKILGRLLLAVYAYGRQIPEENEDNVEVVADDYRVERLTPW